MASERLVKPGMATFFGPVTSPNAGVGGTPFPGCVISTREMEMAPPVVLFAVLVKM